MIIDVFVKLRDAVISNAELRIEIEEMKKKFAAYDKNIELIFQYVASLLEKKENEEPRKVIGYKY